MYTESHIKSLEWSIKFNKKAILSQVGLLVLNGAGFAWNVYEIFHANIPTSNGFGAGMFLSNFLWTLMQVAVWLGEQKREKYELKFMKELEAKEEIGKSKEWYDTAIKTYAIAQENFHTFLEIKNKEIELLRKRLEELETPSGIVNIDGFKIDLKPAEMDGCT